MHRGSYPYPLTPDERLVISKWKWRVGAAYGAILLVLLLVMVANPRRERSDIARNAADQGFSSAAVRTESRSH